MKQERMYDPSNIYNVKTAVRVVGEVDASECDRRQSQVKKWVDHSDGGKC